VIKVYNLRFWVRDLGFRAYGLRCNVKGSWFAVKSLLGFRCNV
jgi:hypothetical protein